MEQRSAYKQRLLAFIERGEGDFDSLARQLFEWQRSKSRTLEDLCRRGGVGESIAGYTEVPPVTADLFRFVRLYGPAGTAPFVFRTSGTTSGARGEHHVLDLDVYRASARRQVGRFLVPDGRRRRALVLAPSPSQLLDSSLSAMLGMIVEEFGQGESLFAWDDVHGLDLDAAIAWLATVKPTDEPVQILATSAALVYLADELERRDLSFGLPPDSVLMPTGGNKGKTRDFDQSELESQLAARLALSPHRVVTEYGMTELVSQYWDPAFADELAGLPRSAGRTLLGPPWCRVDVVEPATMEAVPDGERGLLVFTDLANIDSAMRIQTADVGIKIAERDDGAVEIQLGGRAPGARPRGCSLTVEEASSGG